MEKLNRKQCDYLRRARDSALLNDLHFCRVWTKRAAQTYPLSDLQWFNIQKITSSGFVNKLKDEVLKDEVEDEKIRQDQKTNKREAA